ncbi:MAG: energy-coupling factor transporter ATPase [Oscillospiraceae bacterium]|nr:energy-coupling factor transporter ATPase [Oscillospiraceae bacterium]
MMESMVTFENVVYKYFDNEGKDDVNIAIDGLDLSIKEGKFIAILGRNGSGKSTIAKHINVLLKPTSGIVFVDGINTSDDSMVWNIRNIAGMVFQNPDNQIVATIVEEDVAFGPENLGVDPKEIIERVDDSLRKVHMEDYKKHAPHMLSGGQKQRIAIAGVLAMKPKCIVFDEPTAMLDPVGRKDIMSIIKDLNKNNGITIVLITHYMEEASLADEIIVMDEGKKVKSGTPREVFQDVETMKNIGLDVPKATEIAFRLRLRNIDLPKDILSIDELVKELCRLRSEI